MRLRSRAAFAGRLTDLRDEQEFKVMGSEQSARKGLCRLSVPGA